MLHFYTIKIISFSILLPVTGEEEEIAVCVSTFVELLAGILVDKNEAFEDDDTELLSPATVVVIWLDCVDVIDEVLSNSVVTMIEALDGLVGNSDEEVDSFDASRDAVDPLVAVVAVVILSDVSLLIGLVDSLLNKEVLVELIDMVVLVSENV
jgi:hypothetical protein